MQLVSWATSQGVPLERGALLDPDTVERFCQLVSCGRPFAGDVPFGSAPHGTFTRRGRLPGSRARTPWQCETSPLPTTAPKSNCSGPTPLASRRRPVGAERGRYSPSASAPFDGRWVARVEARSVTRRGGVVEVRVGEPAPRCVVVLAEWEDEVIDLARTAGSDYLIGGRSEAKNRVADLSKRLVRPVGHPRLSPGRLRSTWLRGHLEAGTRLPELCRAAGLQGFEVLSDLLPLVAPLGRADEVAELRGRARSATAHPWISAEVGDRRPRSSASPARSSAARVWSRPCLLISRSRSAGRDTCLWRRSSSPCR